MASYETACFAIAGVLSHRAGAEEMTAEGESTASGR